MEQKHKLQLQRLKTSFEAHGFKLYRIGLYEFRLLNKVSFNSFKLIFNRNQRWAIQYAGSKDDAIYKLAKSILICAAEGRILKIG
ncbi:MAG: hypothetical protein F6K45_07550 [Kamptonema sp. SIO1D9]|nr:hypothetical protein [Kamptonema sp. SIO1D9]